MNKNPNVTRFIDNSIDTQDAYDLYQQIIGILKTTNTYLKDKPFSVRHVREILEDGHTAKDVIDWYVYDKPLK